MNDCVGTKSAVGSCPDGTNSYGALDMGGNTYDWIEDWYVHNGCAVHDHADTSGPETGVYRPVKGGLFAGDIRYSRTSHCFNSGPLDFDVYPGIRCGR